MAYREKARGSYRTQIKRAKKVQASRSAWAKHIDERLKAPKAKDIDEWLSAPNRYDLPNVDANKPKK